jgi:hypothetical protein
MKRLEMTPTDRTGLLLWMVELVYIHPFVPGLVSNQIMRELNFFQKPLSLPPLALIETPKFGDVAPKSAKRDFDMRCWVCVLSNNFD